MMLSSNDTLQNTASFTSVAAQSGAYYTPSSTVKTLGLRTSIPLRIWMCRVIRKNVNASMGVFLLQVLLTEKHLHGNPADCGNEGRLQPGSSSPRMQPSFIALKPLVATPILHSQQNLKIKTTHTSVNNLLCVCVCGAEGGPSQWPHSTPLLPQ
jgi:hypothetical protein